MPAQDVSIAELLRATFELYGGSTPGVWFREHFVAAPFRDEMTALREVLRQAPAAGSEGAQLVEALELEDAEHDREVRFGRGYLALVSDQHWDASVRELAEELGQLLFPDGPRLTAMAYEAEAERGYARAAGLSPTVREKLRRLPVPRATESDPGNLEQWVDRNLQGTAMRLKLMITRAKQVTPAGQPTPMELIVAKHRYLTLVRQLIATIKVSSGMIPAHQVEALGRVQETWRTAVREATARAAARRASGEPVWEPRV